KRHLRFLPGRMRELSNAAIVHVGTLEGDRGAIEYCVRRVQGASAVRAHAGLCLGPIKHSPQALAFRVGRRSLLMWVALRGLRNTSKMQLPLPRRPGMGASRISTAPPVARSLATARRIAAYPTMPAAASITRRHRAS